MIARPAAAQTAAYLPKLNASPYGLGQYWANQSRIDPRLATPPAIELAAANGAPAVDVWVNQNDHGIVVLGQVHALPACLPSPTCGLAYVPAEMRQRGYVEVEVALDPRVAMPPIGWLRSGAADYGQQQGCEAFQDSANVRDPRDRKLEADRLASCRQWQTEQNAFRADLRRVFLRSWKLTRTFFTETVAASAYRDLFQYVASSDGPSLTALGGLKPGTAHPVLEGPIGGANLRSAEPAHPGRWNPADSYFQVLIPWDALPPADTLDLSKFELNVEYCDRAGACATANPQPQEEDPGTWTQLSLGRPFVMSLSPCKYPLQPGGWVQPSASGQAIKSFSLANLFDNDNQVSPSPLPSWTGYFAKRIAPGQDICGPSLRYVVHGLLLPVSVTGEIVAPRWGPDPTVLDAVHISVMALGDGTHLLKYGPAIPADWAPNDGMDGSCAPATVQVYHLDPQRGATRLFDSDVYGTGEWLDSDIEVSKNWATLTVYTRISPDPGSGNLPAWHAARYCRTGDRYAACGTSNAPPPARRAWHWGTMGCQPAIP